MPAFAPFEEAIALRGLVALVALAALRAVVLQSVACLQINARDSMQDAERVPKQVCASARVCIRMHACMWTPPPLRLVHASVSLAVCLLVGLSVSLRLSVPLSV